MKKNTYIILKLIFILQLCSGIVFGQGADTLAPGMLLDKSLLHNMFLRQPDYIKDPIMQEIIHDLKNKLVPPGAFSILFLKRFPNSEAFTAVNELSEVIREIEAVCFNYLKIGSDFSDEIGLLEQNSLRLRNAKEAIQKWTELEGKQGVYIIQIIQGSERMLEKIFNALNWSGRSTEWFDAVAFFEETLGTFNNQQIEISVKMSDDFTALSGMSVSTYKGILNTAIEELVKNAIKYSGSNRIEILVSLTEDKTELRVTVRDFGKGISPEALARLAAGIPVGTEAKEISIGTGNGLFTLKNALESVGGMLTASSEQGKTDFNFSLPVEIPLDVLNAKPNQEQFAIVICGLGGSGRRVMCHWLASKLRLRYINSGFLPRMVFYKLLEEKDGLNIDLRDERAVTEYVEKFLNAGRVDYSTEPVRLDGVNTALPDSDGIIVREKIKMLINDPQNKDLFYKVANYPGVLKALNDFFIQLKTEIKNSGRYNGVVIKSTEPFPSGFTNIALDAPSAVRAARLRFRLDYIHELDLETGRNNFFTKFPFIKRFVTYSNDSNRNILPQDIGKEILSYLHTAGEKNKSLSEDICSAIESENLRLNTIIDEAI